MTKKENTTTAATENNEKNKIVLENGEIMRLSIRRLNDETFDMRFASDGPAMPMVQALMQIMDREFDMICIPRDALGGVISVVAGTADNLKDILDAMNADDDNGEGDGIDAKGETTH